MKIFLLTFFLQIFIYSSYSQTIRGIVVSKPNKKQTEYTLTSKEAKGKVFTYKYSNRKSEMKQVSNDISAIDTVVVEVQGFKLPQEHKIISTSELIYFKDFNINIIKQNSTKTNVDTSIKDVIPIFDWKLTTETQKISGYNCKKATTLNNYYGIEIPVTAWYAEDLKINDGPMIYSGLPGFIIKIEISTFSSYTFQKIVVSKDDIQIEEPVNKAKPITFKEFKI